ncbi:MAG: serine/threonine-protein kinase, partial [Terriglobia bacterium]
MKRCPSCQTSYPDSAAFCPRDGVELRVLGALEPGTTIRRKYRIVEEIGRGGMGVVYRAEHLLFREECAIKVINREYAGEESFVQRFLSEVLVTRQLRHPNIVRVEDADETEDGQPFAVMEYVAGESLRQTIARAGALEPARALYIAAQVCAALTAAHQRGIIHRDIKPDNILVSPQRDGGELIKVLDFGIAKVKEEAGLNLPGVTPTQSGVFVGTPQYASPEQALGKRGEELDARTDIYSLGVVLYEMLTGALPFAADTPMGILLQHIQMPPQPPQVLKPELKLPEAAVAVTMKALEKDRAARFATAEEMRLALERAGFALRRGRAPQPPEPELAETVHRVPPPEPPPPLPPPPQVTPTPAPVEPRPLPSPPRPTAAPPRPTPRPTPVPRPRGRRAVLVGTILVVGLIGAFFLVRELKPPAGPTPQPRAPAETAAEKVRAGGPATTPTETVKSPATERPKPAPPAVAPTVEFSAEPTTIELGQTTTLSWGSSDATELRLVPGLGSVAPQGSRSVSPTEDTTYTLVATGPGGTAEDSIR